MKACHMLPGKDFSAFPNTPSGVLLRSSPLSGISAYLATCGIRWHLWARAAYAQIQALLPTATPPAGSTARWIARRSTCRVLTCHTPGDPQDVQLSDQRLTRCGDQICALIPARDAAKLLSHPGPREADCVRGAGA